MNVVMVTAEGYTACRVCHGSKYLAEPCAACNGRGFVHNGPALPVGPCDCDRLVSLLRRAKEEIRKARGSLNFLEEKIDIALAEQREVVARWNAARNRRNCAGAAIEVSGKSEGDA